MGRGRPSSNISKFDILSITPFKKFEFKNPFLHICDTHICVYLPHTTFRFFLINFQLNTDFPFEFCAFHSKIT